MFLLVFNSEFIINDKILKLNKHLPKLIRLLENNIIGDINKLNFQPGEEVNIFVHSFFKYSVELIRHGLSNTVIKEFGEFEPIIQAVPDRFFVDTGLEWKITHTFNIPEKIRSGFYSLKLSCIGFKDKYFITFIISPFDTNKGEISKVLLLGSSNNWQTYNIWGEK